jgi:hypothetical protein
MLIAVTGFCGENDKTRQGGVQDRIGFAARRI